MFFSSKFTDRIKLLETNSKLLEVVDRNGAEIERLRRKLTAANKELNEWKLYYNPPEVPPLKAERIVSIKFKALFDGLYQPTHFKTGPGPCGKNVKWFTVENTEREIIIHQHHDDGSRKEFVYRRSDIDGRIQYDYEEVELKGKDAKQERVRIEHCTFRPRFAI